MPLHEPLFNVFSQIQAVLSYFIILHLFSSIEYTVSQGKFTIVTKGRSSQLLQKVALLQIIG